MVAAAGQQVEILIDGEVVYRRLLKSSQPVSIKMLAAHVTIAGLGAVIPLVIGDSLASRTISMWAGARDGRIVFGGRNTPQPIQCEVYPASWSDSRVLQSFAASLALAAYKQEAHLSNN